MQHDTLRNIAIKLVIGTALENTILWRARQDAISKGLTASLRIKPARSFLGKTIEPASNEVNRTECAENIGRYWALVALTECATGVSHDAEEEIMLALARSLENMGNRPTMAVEQAPATVRAFARLNNVTEEQAQVAIAAGLAASKDANVGQLEEKFRQYYEELSTRTHAGLRTVIRFDAEGVEYEDVEEVSLAIPESWLDSAYESQTKMILKDRYAERREANLQLLDGDYQALKNSLRREDNTNREIDEQLLSAEGMAQGGQAGK